MVDAVLALTVLVLAAATAILFAMVGELASRIPEFSRATNPGQLQPIDGAQIGHVPDSWPVPLRHLAIIDKSVLLVLSSACASCEELGRQLQRERPSANMAVLVSCATRESGE